HRLPRVARARPPIRALVPRKRCKTRRTTIPGPADPASAADACCCPGDNKDQVTATDGVQFQEHVNVRQNITLSRSCSSVSHTGSGPAGAKSAESGVDDTNC